MTFDEKLGFPTGNHKMIYKFIKDLIKKNGLEWIGSTYLELKLHRNPF